MLYEGAGEMVEYVGLGVYHNLAFLSLTFHAAIPLRESTKAQDKLKKSCREPKAALRGISRGLTKRSTHEEAVEKNCITKARSS